VEVCFFFSLCFVLFCFVFYLFVISQILLFSIRILVTNMRTAKFVLITVCIWIAICNGQDVIGFGDEGGNKDLAKGWLGIDWGNVSFWCTISCANYNYCVMRGRTDCTRPSRCDCSQFATGK